MEFKFLRFRYLLSHFNIFFFFSSMFLIQKFLFLYGELMSSSLNYLLSFEILFQSCYRSYVRSFACRAFRSSFPLRRLLSISVFSSWMSFAANRIDSVACNLLKSIQLSTLYVAKSDWVWATSIGCSRHKKVNSKIDSSTAFLRSVFVVVVVIFNNAWKFPFDIVSLQSFPSISAYA